MPINLNRHRPPMYGRIGRHQSPAFRPEAIKEKKRQRLHQKGGWILSYNHLAAPRVPAVIVNKRNRKRKRPHRRGQQRR